MENQENKNICTACKKHFDILVDGLCVECFEKREIEKAKQNPLDKYEFEEDEYEKLQEDFIKKDIEKMSSENMVVHARPSQQRAIDKIIKVTKNKKK